MAKYNGNNGVIQAVTANGSLAAVGEVKSFSIDTTAEIIEASALGDAAKGALAGHLSWEVSLTANYDPTDVAQADLVEGALIDLKLMPQGNTSLLKTFEGEAVVSSVSVSVSENEVVSFEITATGNGDLTRGSIT